MYSDLIPLGTGRKLNVHKTFRRCPGCLLNVLCTFNLRPVSRGMLSTAYSELSLFRYIQVYSTFLTHIHAYWGIFWLIQAYSAPCVTLVYLQHSHISSRLLELEAYSKPSETLTRHIQSPAIVRTVYSSIIQPYSGMFTTLCNAFGIFGILEYSESSHNCIPMHTQNPVLFTKIGKPCVTLKI